MSTVKNNQNDQFFYAMDDVEYYDETIALTVPYYELIHGTMIEILRYHMSSESSTNQTGIFLDVGAGTGKESLSILRTFPHLKLLAIDVCEPMRRIFQENYAEKLGDSSPKRYQYIIDDIRALSENNHHIREYLETNAAKGCKAAISAYCIHHFPLEEKKEIYRKMYDLLEPGGIMINIDLFSYESAAIKQYAHQFDLEYIKKEFNEPSPQFPSSKAIPLKKRLELMEKWIKHMNNDNILDSIESQEAILRDIGFENVECVLRYWQQGILSATKPITVS